MCVGVVQLVFPSRVEAGHGVWEGRESFWTAVGRRRYVAYRRWGMLLDGGRWAQGQPRWGQVGGVPCLMCAIPHLSSYPVHGDLGRARLLQWVVGVVGVVYLAVLGDLVLARVP
jgi:hypothetical protein